MFFIQEQIAIMRTLQENIRSSSLDAVFKLCNFLDTTEFFFLVIPILWLGYNRKLGIKLFYGAILSSVVNTLLKEYFQLPRPFVLAPDLEVITVSGLSFPSGAAQTAIWLSFVIAAHFKRNIYWVLAIAFSLILSFSRVYLAVHYPLDLIGGWFVGLFLLFFLQSPKGFQKLFSWWETSGKLQQVFFALAISILLFLHSTKGSILGSVFLGIHLGMTFFPKFDREVTTRSLHRAFVGVVGVFSIAILTSAFLREVAFLGYFFIGAWLSIGTNSLFVLRKN